MWIFDRFFKSQYEGLTNRDAVLKAFQAKSKLTTPELIQVCPASYRQAIQTLRKDYDISCERKYVKGKWHSTFEFFAKGCRPAI